MIVDKSKDKYLTIQLLGSKNMRFNAFKVPEDKKVENGPTFTGNGVAVWVNTKKDKSVENKEDVKPKSGLLSDDIGF